MMLSLAYGVMCYFGMINTRIDWLILAVLYVGDCILIGNIQRRRLS